MADYTRKLTKGATVTAGAVDTITLTGPDVTPAAAPVGDAPYAGTPGGTGAGSVKGGRLYNGGAVSLFWSAGPVLANVPSPVDHDADGVYELPAGQTDGWDDEWPTAFVKVSATSDCAYRVEGSA